jgi:uncharacterized protein YdhG (YjbR/CyaY superfamily)
MKKMKHYIEALPGEKRKIIELLRKIIKDTFPEVEEKIWHKIPFFFLSSAVCYINPRSKEVEIRFIKIPSSIPENSTFNLQNEKVLSLVFQNASEINPPEIRKHLEETVRIQHQMEEIKN